MKEVNMEERKYTFKESELTHIITELSRFPYNQVARLINYIDLIAKKQVQEEKKPIQEQIAGAIENPDA